MSRRFKSLRVRCALRTNLESAGEPYAFRHRGGGDLLVNVDATGLPDGRRPPTSPTPGRWAASSRPPAPGRCRRPHHRAGDRRAPAPLRIGHAGIRLDGNDFLQHVAPPGGDLVVPPAGLTVEDATTSIEVWAWNPAWRTRRRCCRLGPARRARRQQHVVQLRQQPRLRRRRALGQPGHGLGRGAARGGAVAPPRLHLRRHHQRVYIDGKMSNYEPEGHTVVDIHDALRSASARRWTTIWGLRPADFGAR